MLEIFFQNVLALSDIKLQPVCDIIFLGKPYSANIILHVSIRPSANRPSSLYVWELAVILINTKVVFIV